VGECNSEQTTLRNIHYFVAFNLMLRVAKNCEHLRRTRTCRVCIRATKMDSQDCQRYIDHGPLVFGHVADSRREQRRGRRNNRAIFCAFDTSEGATSCNTLMRRPRFEELESEAVCEAILIVYSLCTQLVLSLYSVVLPAQTP
jgi:hypothetical protein